MQFLTKSDLYLLIDPNILDQITDCKDSYLDAAEQKALEEVRQWLSPRFDIEYELRGYIDYSPNVIYSDGQRVRLVSGDTFTAFEAANGITLISNGIADETIITKRINTCQPALTQWSQSLYLNNLINKTYLPTNWTYPTVFTYNNPDYVATCGIIPYLTTSDGSKLTQAQYQSYLTGGTIPQTIVHNTFSSDQNFDYFQTLYTPTGSLTGQTATTSVIDYNYQSLVSGFTPSHFFKNVSYFNQYLLDEVNIDFVADERNATLIDIISSLTLYQVARRVSYRGMDSLIVDAHDLSMDKLKDFNKGRRQIDLKQIPFVEQTQSGMGFRFGFNTESEFNRF